MIAEQIRSVFHLDSFPFFWKMDAGLQAKSARRPIMNERPCGKLRHIRDGKKRSKLRGI
jgi:hypothetical protein